MMNEHRKRILVADCDDDILIGLEKLLEDAGFDTTTVWTAREALRFAESHTFDLVLLNEHLPDAEGQEVLKAFQKRGEAVPCIVLHPSAPEIVDFTRFEALGARDLISKHCFRQIVERVKVLLGDGTKQPSAA